ncbi:MAG TPA: pyrimidine dimer DNA glycosylase/endonuclease V [Thermoanaerobaculia bacterium]
MRLWTVHPQYLDAAGLTALWREALLARKVLMNRTRGYRHHPQLLRFREQRNPVAWINSYLVIVHAEAALRGYSFDRSKIGRTRASGRLVETAGQLAFEWEHLGRKLRRRNREASRRLTARKSPEASPLFRIVRGGVREWEKAGRA